MSQIVLTAEGSGLQGGNTAVPCVFTLKTADGAGKALSFPADVFAIQITGPHNKNIQAALKSNNDGTYTVTYQPLDEGHHDVVVNLKQTLRVGIAVGTDAGKTKVFGPGLEDGVQDNLPTFFNIHAHGTDGQPMRQGGDPFVVKITGPQGDVPAKLTDNGDGTYKVDYAPDHAGPHKVEVHLRDQHVANSPYTVNVKEGADHNTSFIESAVMVIRGRTKKNQNMTRGGENFSVAIEGPAGPVKNVLKDNQDGTYTDTYSLSPEARGAYNFHLQVNKKEIQGSPFVVNY